MINNVNIFNIWHRCSTCTEKKCIDSISLIYNWLIMWIFLIFDIDMHWQKKLSWSVKLINNMYMRNLTISHTNICIIFDKIVQYVYINFFKLFSLIYKYVFLFQLQIMSSPWILWLWGPRGWVAEYVQNAVCIVIKFWTVAHFDKKNYNVSICLMICTLVFLLLNVLHHVIIICLIIYQI